MAKSILISIKPRYVADILNHKKTIEVRKSMPKCELPIQVYIYCSKTKPHINLWTSKTEEKYKKVIPNISETQLDNDLDEFVNVEFINKYPKYKGKRIAFEPLYLNGKVVAKFTLNKVEEIKDCLSNNLLKKSCLNGYELADYLNFEIGYAWHIDDLVIFDIPLPLQPYFDLNKAPQSWCYIES